MVRDAESLTALLDTVRRFVRERLVPAEGSVADTAEFQLAQAMLADHGIERYCRDVRLFRIYEGTSRN
ncbi:MAG TPA: hypothetical protein VLJ62_05165 [Burkholderiaceae bacterium]|nr:hypothetical protein [Burkholderiaceae bacterium]